MLNLYTLNNLKKDTHNMRNKLEEINLAMVAIKFGEDVAYQIADLFTDEDIVRTKKQIISEKRKMANAKSLEVRWGKKQNPKRNPDAMSNRKHLFDSSMEAFKQLAALKKEVEGLYETINSSIQTIIDIYLNTEKETKR